MSENDNEVLEATNSNEEQELEINLDDNDDVEALRTQITEKDNFAKQAIARAKKAEAELKALKGSKPAEANQNTQNSPASLETIEETILKAQGESQEMIDQLKKIAQVTGKTLIDARQDPYYLSLKKAQEDEVKSAKAKLPASRGSGKAKQEKSFSTPGLSEAEFKELWKEKNGR
jgi:hypothetical protein